MLGYTVRGSVLGAGCQAQVPGMVPGAAPSVEPGPPHRDTAPRTGSEHPAPWHRTAHRVPGTWYWVWYPPSTGGLALFTCPAFASVRRELHW